ncbi:MAG TPA: VanZ family protein [Syntrophales bacterium]|nr:VanZ family protein [Syntrophales bacterium]
MKFNLLKNYTGFYHNFIKYWLPVILWMVAIFGMSTDAFSSEHTSRFIVPLLNFLFPGLLPHDVDLVHELIRKASHVSEYIVLGLLLFRAFRRDSSEGWRMQWAIYAVIGVIIYAAGDEFHQSFVATRSASLMDVVIDSIGGVLSQIVIMFWHFLWKK